MISNAFGELRSLVTQRNRKQKQKLRLDLCFAIGEEALQLVWDQAYGQSALASEEGRSDALCTVLWQCAERPTALSICHHAEPALLFLPHILSQMRAAADTLSVAVVQFGFVGVGSEGETGGGGGCLPWRECGRAVALLNAALSLFVHLSATPQYRQLLLQNDVPQASCTARRARVRVPTVCEARLRQPPRRPPRNSVRHFHDGSRSARRLAGGPR